MGKLRISKELVQSFANQDHKKYLKNINKKVNGVLSLAIDDLSNKVSYVNLKNVTLQPVNEIISGAYVDNSNCTYFLGINNAQLEINTSKRLNFFRNLKVRFIYAWKNRKQYRKAKKRRRWKRRREKEQNSEKEFFDPTKYDYYKLAADLQNSLIKFLSETTIVEMKDNMIKIIGKDDFGSSTNILIYITGLSDNIYKFYSPTKRKCYQINIDHRVDSLAAKIKTAGENFVKMIKIFNSLFYNINGHMPNQVFVESVLSYCPDELYQAADINKAYIKVVNYIRLKTLKDIPSINDPSKTIINDVVCGQNTFEFSKLLNAYNL